MAATMRAHASPSSKLAAPGGAFWSLTASRTTSAQRWKAWLRSSPEKSKASRSPWARPSTSEPSPESSRTPSEPKTLTALGRLTDAANELSKAPVTPDVERSSALEAVFSRASLELAVLVGPVLDRGPRRGADLIDVAKEPPEEVDAVRAPCSDPPSAERRIEEPAELPQGRARDGQHDARLDVLRIADRAGTDELTKLDPGVPVAELEVDESHDPRLIDQGAHLLSVRDVPAERLVAQHVVTSLGGKPHVVKVHERGRVHRHQIEVVSTAESGDCVSVSSRDDVDDLAAIRRREEGCHDAAAEATPDDANLHRQIR